MGVNADTGPLKGDRMTLLALFSMMIFGSAFWTLVLALDDIPPITLAFLRAFIAAVFMMLMYLFLGLVLGRKGWLKKERFLYAGLKDRKNIVLVIGTAFFGMVLPNIMQNVGMLMMDPSSTSSLASLIQGIGPIFTIFLAWIFLKERLGIWKIIGLLIAIPCMIVLTIYTKEGLSIGSDAAIGGILNLLTAMSYAVSGILLKMVLNKGADPVSLLGLNSAFGALLLLPITLGVWILSIEEPIGYFSISLTSGLSLFYLSVCVYAVAAIIWYKVIRSGDLSRVIFFIFLLPVFSVLLGYLLLGERLEVVQLLAGGLLLFGIWVSQRSKKDNKPQPLRPPKV